MPIPVTVVTGFLGAGKTTVLIDLIKQLPPTDRCVLIKNEYGSVAVDSQLARLSSIKGVQEMINGCMCCVLVGQMQNALEEVVRDFSPDRVVIETSGSALPAPLAWQINEIQRAGILDIRLDSIVTVIDCCNFVGYEDRSYTARLQAQYTDLIVLNKWELVADGQMDRVMDLILELNPDTPVLRAPVSVDVVFSRSPVDHLSFASSAEESGDGRDKHHHSEIEVVSLSSVDFNDILTRHQLESILSQTAHLSKEVIYRLKGFIWLQCGDERLLFILNFAFERFELLAVGDDDELVDRYQSRVVDLTAMGPSRVEMRV
eukprot:Partr_v1_DN26154_c0_g1_i3_m10281 putative CobW domain-containing protein